MLGVSLGRVGSIGSTRRTGGGYLPEASALFARASLQPSPDYKAAVNARILAYKNAGIWDLSDVIYAFAAEDSQFARLNWKGAYSNVTAVGSPVFTANAGYAANGSSSYLNTGFNPGDGGAHQFSQNSAHFSVWSLTDAVLASGGDIGARVSSTSRQTILLSRNSSSTAIYRVNHDTPGSDASNSNSSGDLLGQRTSASAISMWRNGSQISANTFTSSAPANLHWFIGAINNNGSPSLFASRQYALASGGASLSDEQIMAKYNADLAFLQAIGAV